MTSSLNKASQGLVYYNKNIKGKLSFGSVSDVSGIQAKKLFIWVSVTGIHTEQGSDLVEFYVGALSEKLPAKQFEDIPVCKSKACQGASVDYGKDWILCL
ncbi:hypothetical protein M0R45_010267 [Rubus argutus]|uniref:Uncharacterized protein n=1 Tax=Rubus argutus TaxID=59490 RepID=A0AAW1Y8Y4_RUBAR